MNKIAIERNQKTLLELVVLPGNGKFSCPNICADCKARNPRWASHNLGIFICVNCASIHRKIGTHITKVKSLTMDAWTKEQVEMMKAMGNIKSNAIYNSNEFRHPPPPNLMDGERDSELEQYIRSKYEFKRFMDKSALVSSKLGPSRSASSIASSGTPRAASTPLTHITTSTATASSIKETNQQQRPSIAIPSTSSVSQTRSVSQPLSIPQQSQQGLQGQASGNSGVWADLVSLQAPGSNSSLPLQFQAMSAPSQPLNSQQSSFLGNVSAYQTGMGMGVNPFQQHRVAANPFSHQPYSASAMTSPAFSTTPTLPYTSINPQHNFLSDTSQMHPPASAPAQAHFLQPQPRQGGLQVHVPPDQSSFALNSGQGNFTPSPSIQPQFLPANLNQQTLLHGPQSRTQMLSHSPQPQVQMMSISPHPQMQTQMSASQQVPYMSPSPQQQMGIGTMSGTPHGYFLSTTPQPQTEIQAQQAYYTGAPQLQMPQNQFSGYQAQGQPQPFITGGYSGPQWGAM